MRVMKDMLPPFAHGNRLIVSANPFPLAACADVKHLLCVQRTEKCMVTPYLRELRPPCAVVSILFLLHRNVRKKCYTANKQLRCKRAAGTKGSSRIDKGTVTNPHFKKARQKRTHSTTPLTGLQDHKIRAHHHHHCFVTLRPEPDPASHQRAIIIIIVLLH
jgi:hypothetical protein